MTRIISITPLKKGVRLSSRRSPVKPQRHQDTKFIKNEAQVLQSQCAKYLTSTSNSFPSTTLRTGVPLCLRGESPCSSIEVISIMLILRILSSQV